MYKILLLEDDELLGETIEDLLDDAGYAITWCRNGQEALDKSYEGRYDLYLFDINVPLIDGLSLLNELRGANDATPTIFLTSHQEHAKVLQGFENGADDYIKKPAEPQELLFRIAALIKRSAPKVQECHAELCINREQREIFEAGALLQLSQKEYALLDLFIQHKDKTVTKEMIADALWHHDESVSDGAIRVYVNRLKQELKSVEIENIRGVGYRLIS